MESPVLRDAGAAVLTGATALAVLRFWEEVGNRALLDQVTSPLLPSPTLLTVAHFSSL